MTINPSSGVVSTGTNTPAGNYTLAIQAADSWGNARGVSGTFQINLQEPSMENGAPCEVCH